MKYVLISLTLIFLLGFLYSIILKIQKDEELEENRRKFIEGRIKNPHPYDYIKSKPIEPGWEYGNTIEHKEEIRS